MSQSKSTRTMSVLEKNDEPPGSNESLDKELNTLPTELNDVLRFVPKDQKKAAKRELMMYSESFSGPLPHPSIIAGYENVCPGATDRIISIQESEVQHRHDMDHKSIDYTARDNKLNMQFSFYLLLILVLISALLLFFDKKIEGSIFGAASVLLIIKSLMSDNKSKH